MKLDTLLNSDAVIVSAQIKSKKRTLEKLAEKLAEQAGKKIELSVDKKTEEKTEQEVDSLDIFQRLIEREKLGATCIGHGVALPHARTNLSDKAIGAFLKLENGIDFGGSDEQKTDLIFALMVPESYTSEHLKILAMLATMFSDSKFCQRLREHNQVDDLYQILLKQSQSD